MQKTSESSVALGQRLKRLRQQRGLSQRELGRQAGVTNSNISMIEQGLVSPSVASLERLLAVIPMSLEQFFTWNPEAAEGQVFRAQDLSSFPGPGRGFDIQTLSTNSLSLLNEHPPYLERYMLAPGGDTGDRCHKEPGSRVAWLIQGQVQLNLGAGIFSLIQNDGFCVPARQTYRLRNLGEEEAVLILAGEAQLDA